MPVHLVSKKPLIRLNEEQEVVDVVWAPPFEGRRTGRGEETWTDPVTDSGVLPLMVPASSKRFFQAYHAFASLIQESTDLRLEHRLDQGQMLCFNNRRMLHGRRAFELQHGAVRHLKVRETNVLPAC